MKFSKNNILKSFDSYDIRVLDFLEYILDEIKAKQKDMNNYTLVILQLLATQLTIYFKAEDAVKSGVIEVSETKYGNVRKLKPEVTTLNQSHKEITHLLDKLGLSPLESAKIKKLKSTSENANESGEALLNILV